MGGGDRGERVAVPALGNPARFDRLDLHGGARLHRLDGEVEHRLHDGRDPGNHIDIADAKPRRNRDRVLDQLRSGRDAGHAPPRRRQIARRIALKHGGDNARVFADRDPNARATASAVISSWVGPMPPVVTT